MFSRVLVPLDGSPTAESVLPFIEQIAGPLDMEIHLLQVIALEAEEVLGTRHVGPDSPMEVAQREAADYLDTIVKKLDSKGVRAEPHVRIGTADREIVTAARELNADLIAMTTHGRTGLGRLVFGSVAQQVLQNAATPLFLYKG